MYRLDQGDHIHSRGVIMEHNERIKNNRSTMISLLNFTAMLWFNWQLIKYPLT